MHVDDEDNDFNFYWFLDLSWEMKKTGGTVGQADGWVRNIKQAADIETPQLVIQCNSQQPSKLLTEVHSFMSTGCNAASFSKLVSF
jgi:hypothetical protein